MSETPSGNPSTSESVVITNQHIINAFVRAAAALGLAEPWGLMSRAGLNLAMLAGDRLGAYQGPSLDKLPNLTAEEKTALTTALAQLTDPSRPTPPPPSQGSLRGRDELKSVPLAPSIDREIGQLPPNATPSAQMMARIWNHYGGLLDKVGTVLNVDPTLAAGVLAVESGGRAFGASGRMTIRFELHVFYNLWGRNNQEQFDRYFKVDPNAPWRGESHQWRTDPSSEWKPVHAGQQGEWDAFSFARVYCSDTAAKMSISMGAPQIMGFNHARIGYGDVDSMYDAFENDERSQVLGFFDFVRTDSRLLEAMRSQDLNTFATYYNGTAVADTYAGLMRDAVTKLRYLMPERSGEEIPFGPGGPPYGIEAPPSPTPVAKPGVGDPSHQPVPLPEQLPLPPATEAQLLRDMDPTLYGYWRDHVREGFEQNSEMFNRVLDAFMEPYYTTIWMYRVLFAMGVLSFITAVVLTIWTKEPWYGLIFGGLSAGAFFAYFFNRPLQALEENLHFVTWLGIIYNTYWTRLAYMFDQNTIQDDLHAATTDAVTELDKLLDKHAELSGKRPKAE
jgi:hypothetical protein